LDFALKGKLIHLQLALYVVRVPKAGALLPTSFRLYLTIDALVLASGWCLPTPTGAFHPLATAHAGRTL